MGFRAFWLCAAVCVYKLQQLLVKLHHQHVQPFAKHGDIVEHVYREFNLEADRGAKHPNNCVHVRVSKLKLYMACRFIMYFDGSYNPHSSGSAWVLYDGGFDLDEHRPVSTLPIIATGSWHVNAANALEAELMAAHAALSFACALVAGPAQLERYSQVYQPLQVR